MKKFLLFWVIFIFLAGLGWGQQVEFTWTGDGLPADWNDPNNWDVDDPGGIITGSPGDGVSSYIIIIQSSLNDPVFSSAGSGLECDTLIIESGASLDMGVYELNVNTIENDGELKTAGDLTVDVSFVNNGNLLLSGNGSQTVTIPATSFTENGTVTYDDAGGVDFAGLTGFYNLIINNGIRSVLLDAITVSGDFILTDGSLEAAAVSVTGTSTIAGNITTAAGNQTYNGAVTLDADIELKGLTVTTIGVITGNSHSLEITGDGVLHGGSGIDDLIISGDFSLSSGSLSTATVDVTGTSNIAANIITTGAQTYTGAVTLGANIELVGLTITTLGSIDGNVKSLTITGEGFLRGGYNIDDLLVQGDLNLVSGLLSAATVNVSGTSNLNGNVTTTGNQTYTGAVILENNVNFTADAGSTVHFFSSVNGITSVKDLTITGANVVFDGTVGSSFIKNVTVAAGNTAINANITSTGNQDFGSGNVTINGTHVLTSTGGSIAASVIVHGTSVTVRASQGISLAGANTLGGNITLENTQTGTPPNGDIVFNNTSTSIVLSAENDSAMGEINVIQTGDLSITSLKTGASGSISVEAAGKITQTGAITGQNINIKTTDEITQSATAAITASKLVAKAQKDIILTSKNKIGTSVDLSNSAGNISFTNENSGVLGVTAAADDGNIVIIENDGSISGELEGNDITVSAGGNITLTDITGETVILNAGYPEHMAFGKNGTITLTDFTVINLTIWCKNVVSSGGTGSISGDVNFNTDDTDDTEIFLDDFSIISTLDNNKLRTKSYEFGSTHKYSYLTFFDSNNPSSWPIPSTIFTGFSNIYITDPTSIPYDLIISTEFGNIVFEGDYDATGHNLDLSTTGGQVIQSEGTITVNIFTVNIEGDMLQNGGKIIADELDITSNKAITLARDNEVKKLTINSAGGKAEYNNNTDMEISGINAGANDVSITVNGDINLTGGITGADVSVSADGSIDLSGDINASKITIEASSITGSAKAAASTIDVSLNNHIAGIDYFTLDQFIALNGNIFIQTNAKDIVYYSSVPPAAPPPGETWTTPLFVEASSAFGGKVKLQTNDAANNIYLADAVDSSGKTLTVNSASGGFIEFFTTGVKSYTYSGANHDHLDLLPGAGGIRIVGAVIDIAGDFKINNINKKLTLDGTTGSGIKAMNINLGVINALNSQDLTLETSEDISITGTVGTTGSFIGNVIITGRNITVDGTINTNMNVSLEASGNITIEDKVTAYQLIAKAPTGIISVDEIDIDLSNTGNEGLNAAIYIEAGTFVVKTTKNGSIIPGGTNGQLCLVLIRKWEDTNSVVDGPEDDPPGLIHGARWHQHISGISIEGKILYSFTEDSSGNGRLDRIRVQTNAALNGDFSGFDVSVEEYEIDRTKGTKGFQIVSVFTGKAPFDNDSFYIYLIEKPEIDGGNTPRWSIVENTTLKSPAGLNVGDPAVDKNIKPIDTIPPRIEYTLTLPGHPQTFMLVTEPVASSSGADINASFGGISVQGDKVNPSGLGYLFKLPGSLRIEDLAKSIVSSSLENGYFQPDNIFDKEPKPDWSAVDSAFPPKYPLNWGYKEYAKVANDTGSAQSASGTVPFSDVFTPPNKLLAVDMMINLANNKGNLVTPNNAPVIRRVTDVLVSMAPANTNSDNYFAWPVWARFKKSLNAPYTSGNDIFWGQQSTDTGIIWQFDGTNFLETNFIDSNEGLELQARMNDNLPGTPVLFWTTSNIPAEYRNPKEATEAKKVGGLWLPNVFSPLYNYVPLSDGINGKPADNASSKLFNYDIAANSLNVESGAKFEFIFRLSNVPDLFIARLDIPRGAAIPANWYTLIRPFTFDIQNIRRQRGGVTVLNNVINSNNRETAFIRYHLTRPGRVNVQIYTLDGTLVKSIKRGEQRDAGEWTDSWDGTNNGGRAVARGMYFVRVVGPDIDEIRKIMVVK